jgi:hypothetical protein
MISEATITICLLIIAILVQLAITYKIFSGFKKLLEEKNLRLIQLYLDTKFISKIILDSLKISSSKEFCESATRDIIAYYNLEDIIITSSDITPQTSNNSLRGDVIKFIKEHSEQIENLLRSRNFIQVKIDSNSRKLQLYISAIKDIVSQGLIICIENVPVLLSENELSSMENCINLMKTRLAQPS